ncbi:EamA family transporter [Vibrio sp. 1CM23M]|uniref:EamA family transporter n=1 Tax=Vibrio sp. 1CM23M TaxID=2929164 RepID=UPI0020BF2886|nr:EamA family transporter [Vibrio sp. 1CM23M]MCK8072224.1 EamA family transporter [Vibrio sp. 1CM23M]
MSHINLIIVLTSVAFASLGQLFLKVGAINMNFTKCFLNVWLSFGIICYVIGAILWVYALSQEDLIKVFPFTALTFFITYFFGYFVLGESVNKYDIFGLILIISGLLIIVNN